MGPTFTVIVPTYRRPDKLAACMAGLANQDLQKSDYEIVVVDDDGKTNAARRILDNTHGVTCRLATQNHLGPAAARNVGASIAEGRYLAFTDDDCRPAPNWLNVLKTHIARNEAPVLIGGKVINSLKDDPFASAGQALVDFLYGYFNRDPQDALMLTSNNFCLPADAFHAVGGFDTAFLGAGGEDRELCMRWSHSGHRLVYAEDAIVYHSHDMTLYKFIRQHLAYGRGAAVLRRRAVDGGFGPIPLEPASFYWNLLCYPRTVEALSRPWTTSVLFAISQAANGAGYFYTRINEFYFFKTYSK
jgi:GT2 family glycosyltransferase